MLSGLSLTDQSNGSEQPNPEGDTDLIETVETAKTITDINQQSLHTDNTNTQTTAIVDDEFDNTDLAETNLLLLDLVDIGFDLITSHSLVSRYENRDIQQALNRAQEVGAFNPPVNSVCLLVRDDNETHYRLLREYELGALHHNSRAAQL